MSLIDSPRDVDGAVASEFDDGIDDVRRGRIARIAVWLVVGVDACFVAFAVASWFVLRSIDAGRTWRGAGCTPTHACATTQGDPLTHLVAQAGPSHLIPVVGCIVVAAGLVRMAELAARRGTGRRVPTRWAGAALMVTLLALVTQAAAITGLPFRRFDGIYATTYWYFMVSNALHLAVAAVILFGLWNRFRLGRLDGGDGTTVGCIRIFTTWVACAVGTMVIVSSVFA